MSTELFSNIYNGPFKRYLLLSRNIGQDVLHHSELADLAFHAEMRYIEFSENFRKPDTESVILNPILDQIGKTMRYVGEDPSMSDHVSLVAQSIKALLWIHQEDPVSYLEEVLLEAKTYTDCLLVFFKNKEPHTEWVEAWLETLNDLNNFVRRRYPKGLTWKGDVEAPDSLCDISDLRRVFDQNALYDEISKGETIHQVLKRANALSGEDVDENKLETELKSTKLNEVFAQEGKKWRIEHKKGTHKHLTIDEADTDNVVYIYDCSNITVVVEKKINVIKLDNCDKVCVIFRSLISGLDMVCCKNIKLHAFGTLPSVNAENCSDVNVHLTKKALDAQVVTSQCSKISLSYPLEDGYYKTFDVPTRLMTTINPDYNLNTNPINDA
ncbi:hypothetical protein WA026_009567 [Henosepilachna vigintioctopunctata]|uniref:C-CAP/cofactor C-like domain-containing protein n=1 Tax=Henosepilachna vigintioctopunctata TaxID=420089 RepID=A0AAW1U8X3_9CUCU